MNFMESVTLVNMLPQGFKHGARRLAAHRVLQRIMIMAMLLLCSAHASAEDGTNPTPVQNGPPFWKSSGFWGWLATFIVGIIVMSVGIGLPDFGDAGGASQFMQTALIGIGITLGFTGLACTIMKCHALSIQPGTLDAEGNYEETQYDKARKLVANTVAALIFLTVLVLVFYSGFSEDGGNLLIGKSMTFMSLLGMAGVAGVIMWRNYSKDDHACKAMMLPAKGCKWLAKTITNKVDGERNWRKFVFSSKTFWFSLLCVLCLIGSFVVGDWQGNSMMMKIGIITVSTAMLIAVLFNAKSRFEAYKNGKGSHADWATNKDAFKPSKHNKYSIFVALALIALVSVILFGVGFSNAADGNMYFGGTGTGSIFTVMVLAGIGFGGLYKIGAFTKQYWKPSENSTKQDHPEMADQNTARTMHPEKLNLSGANSNSSTSTDALNEDRKQDEPVTNAQSLDVEESNLRYVNKYITKRNGQSNERRRLAALERMIDTSL